MSLGIGKRTLKRRAMNKRLMLNFIAGGWPQTCELKLPKCMKTWALSWAHSKKSRFLITDDDWLTAALACPNCHQTQEALPHKKGEKMILDAIARRHSS